MARIAIVVLSGQDDPGRAKAGLHVAKRIHDARAENGICAGIAEPRSS